MWCVVETLAGGFLRLVNLAQVAFIEEDKEEFGGHLIFHMPGGKQFAVRSVLLHGVALSTVKEIDSQILVRTPLAE